MSSGHVLGTCQLGTGRGVFLGEGGKSGRTDSRPMYGTRTPERYFELHGRPSRGGWFSCRVGRSAGQPGHACGLRSLYASHGQLAAYRRGDRHHAVAGSRSDDASGQSRCGWLASRHPPRQGTMASPERGRRTHAHVSGGLLVTLTCDVPGTDRIPLFTGSSRSRLPVLLAPIKRSCRTTYDARRPGRLRHDLRRTCSTGSAGQVRAGVQPVARQESAASQEKSGGSRKDRASVSFGSAGAGEVTFHNISKTSWFAISSTRFVASLYMKGKGPEAARKGGQRDRESAGIDGRNACQANRTGALDVLQERVVAEYTDPLVVGRTEYRTHMGPETAREGGQRDRESSGDRRA